jgi:hypothetical protein
VSYVFERIEHKVEACFAKLTEPVRNLAETAACKIYVGLGLLLPPRLRSPHILKVYFRAIDDYEPEVSPGRGRVIIFRGTPRWRTFVGSGVEIQDVPGGHWDILKEPHIRVWAERLKSYLEEAQGATEAHAAGRHSVLQTKATS